MVRIFGEEVELANRIRSRVERKRGSTGQSSGSESNVCRWRRRTLVTGCRGYDEVLVNIFSFSFDLVQWRWHYHQEERRERGNF